MKVDFKKFEQTLPYASELYGIYQPLLGWRSRMRSQELADGKNSLKRSYLKQVEQNTQAVYQIEQTRIKAVDTLKVEVGKPVTGQSALDSLDSIVTRKVREFVAKENYSEKAWRKYTSLDALKEILASSRKDIQDEAVQLAA